MRPRILPIILMAAFSLAATAAPRGAWRRVPADTLVMVELAEPLSTKAQRAGDTFAIRLAEPLAIGGRLVLPVGTKGQGTVVESAKPGLGGKPAKMVLAVQSIDIGGRHIPLKAMAMAGQGKSHGAVSAAAGLTGFAFMPLGFAALAIRGGDVTLPEGTRATAKFARAVTLASLGPAPRDYQPVVAASEEPPPGAVAVPTPPAGQGLVVFFRKKSMLGTGQWFNVREDGKALGKLGNGAWFALPVSPGTHTYTASVEPEFKDKLNLQIDAGETYFVEGTLAKGVVISTAVLGPSDRAAFNEASKDLKADEGPGEDKDEAAQKRATAPSSGGG